MYERCACGMKTVADLLPVIGTEGIPSLSPSAMMLPKDPVRLAVSWQRISQSSSVIARTRFFQQGWDTFISLAFHPSVIWASKLLVCEFRLAYSPFCFEGWPGFR